MARLLLDHGAVDVRDYYRAVFDRLVECFDRSAYAVATGREIRDEASEAIFPSIAEPVERLAYLACERALEIHLPVIGAKSRSVLMPLDIELFLGPDNHRIYSTRRIQQVLLGRVMPVLRFYEERLRDYGIPYLLDYTPSGGHLLFHTDVDSAPGRALQAIGFVEEDLADACRFTDPADVRRSEATSLEAAHVFSGLGKIAEYLAMRTMREFRGRQPSVPLPVTVGDAYERCVNLDNSWTEGSPFMRCIRSPFSLHRKNRDRYGLPGPPLVDVIGCHFDGRRVTEERDLDTILDGMWDLGRAAAHAGRFPGRIPASGDGLVALVDDYRASDLYAYHCRFEATPALPSGEALARARSTRGLSAATRKLLRSPNPAALQPGRMLRLVRELVVAHGWEPRHVANTLRDLYDDASFRWDWDFYRYPSDAKANFWARCYGGIVLAAVGKL